MIKKFLLCFLMIGLLFSCRREIEKPSWDVDLNAPILFSDMGIEDLIPDSLLQTNSDNSLNLVFDQTIFSYGIDSLLAVPDSTIKDSFMSIGTAFISPGFTLFNNVDNNKLIINSTELTRVHLKQGLVDYTVTSTVVDTMIVTYSITTGTIGGFPISIEVTVPPAPPGGASTVSGVFDLSGSELDLTGPLHNSFNAYQTRLTVKTSPGLTGVTVSPGNKVKFQANFKNMVPSYVRGYFGNELESSPLESTVFDFLKNLNGTELDLSLVHTNLYLSNGLGADARIKIDTIASYNSSSNQEVFLSHSLIGSNLNINRATDAGYYAIPYTYSNSINSANSNIESFIENLPDELRYKVELELNPLGNVSAHTDFLYENSRVEAGLSVNIPLNLMASKLKLRDTVSFNLDDYDRNGKILKGRIKFNIQNGLPLEANVVVKMLDDNNMVIGYLINGMLIQGNLGSTSSTPGYSSSQTINAELDSDNIEIAYRARKLVIEAEFATVPSGTFVSLYNTQRFKTQVSLQVDYRVQ